MRVTATVLAISSHPLPTLPAFLASRRDELLRADTPSLLKALELSGHWEWALALLRWAGAEGAVDASALEMVVRALGREGQHDAVCALLDEMPLPPGSRLDVRAYTTVLHALSRAGRYERAVELFAELRRQGVAPTLVTYNVVLDVYGRMGRSWPRIVALLDEMRVAGVEPDDFTASTVIGACCRDGLVDEAVAFFEDLKARGHAPCVVTYNALLQVFGKAGNYTEALRVLKEGGVAILQDRTPEDVALPGAPTHLRGYFFECFPRLSQFEGGRRPPRAKVEETLRGAGFTQVASSTLEEVRKRYAGFAALEADLAARTGRSILHELSDSELRELIGFIKAKLPPGPIVEKDRWTVWTGVKP